MHSPISLPPPVYWCGNACAGAQHARPCKSLIGCRCLRSRCLVVHAAWGREGPKQPVQVVVEAPHVSHLPPPLPASTAWLLIGLQVSSATICLRQPALYGAGSVL